MNILTVTLLANWSMFESRFTYHKWELKVLLHLHRRLSSLNKLFLRTFKEQNNIFFANINLPHHMKLFSLDHLYQDGTTSVFQIWNSSIFSLRLHKKHQWLKLNAKLSIQLVLSSNTAKPDGLFLVISTQFYPSFNPNLIDSCIVCLSEEKEKLCFGGLLTAVASCCSARAVGGRAGAVVVVHGLSISRHVGSSWTQGWNLCLLLCR